MKKRAFSIVIALVLLLGILPAALAAVPKITKQPKAQTVAEGGSCTFTAAAKDVTGITWRIYNEETGEDMPFTDAPDHFAGLRMSGKNSNTLKLSNIPAEMDGWLVYCRYGNSSGRVDTQKVKLTVESEEKAEEEKKAEQISGAAAQGAPAEGEKIITATGCYIQYVTSGGKAQGEKFTDIDFTQDYKNPVTGLKCAGGMLDCKVTADVPGGARIAYWVINGARYDFDMTVKSILIEELTWSANIEVVYDNDSAETYLSDEEAAAKATGERLLAESINAKMSLTDENGKPDGGYFYDFDFTEEYHNPASGDLVDGGLVDLKVIANVPAAHIVSYWKFNEAKFDFNSTVSWFTVDNLNESMIYQPVLFDNSTPVPSYSVSCKGCTFSGGGYSGATSGTVPYGTKITITPNRGSSIGCWTGSYSAGSSYNGVSNKPITWVVDSNCSFVWQAQIN